MHDSLSSRQWAAIKVHTLIARVNDANFWSVLEKTDLPGEFVGSDPDIIGVEERDETAARVSNANIPRMRKSTVHLAMHPQPGITLPLFDDFRRIVRGTVVDDLDFNFGVCLAQYRANCLGKKPRHVVARDDDADEVGAHCYALQIENRYLPERSCGMRSR